MFERENFPVGDVVITPSGRRAIVVKHLSGASKFDLYSRVVCRYEGGGAKDLVTLQPEILKKAEKQQQEKKPAVPVQPSLFACSSTTIGGLNVRRYRTRNSARPGIPSVVPVQLNLFFA